MGNKIKSMKKNIGALMTAMAMLDSSVEPQQLIRRPDRTTRHEVIPYGCKKYYFNEYGELFENANEILSVQIFTCIAINKKSAHKKYQKFLNANPFQNPNEIND